LTGVAASATKGVFKTRFPSGTLVAELGLAGDFHARGGKRQVSLLRQEVIDDLAALQGTEILPGDLGENLTVSGLDLDRLPAGTILAVGATARLLVTERREPCRNVEKVARGLKGALEGRAGVLARVLRGGEVKPGDAVEVEAPA
jgi:MOSC domain-containing protein YiiM